MARKMRRAIRGQVYRRDPPGPETVSVGSLHSGDCEDLNLAQIGAVVAARQPRADVRSVYYPNVRRPRHVFASVDGFFVDAIPGGRTGFEPRVGGQSVRWL